MLKGDCRGQLHSDCRYYFRRRILQVKSKGQYTSAHQQAQPHYRNTGQQSETGPSRVQERQQSHVTHKADDRDPMSLMLLRANEPSSLQVTQRRRQDALTPINAPRYLETGNTITTVRQVQHAARALPAQSLRLQTRHRQWPATHNSTPSGRLLQGDDRRTSPTAAAPEAWRERSGSSPAEAAEDANSSSPWQTQWLEDQRSRAANGASLKTAAGGPTKGVHLSGRVSDSRVGGSNWPVRSHGHGRRPTAFAQGIQGSVLAQNSTATLASPTAAAAQSLLQEVETEASLRSDSKSQQAAGVMQEEEDSELYGEGESTPEGVDMSEEALRIAALKESLMKAVMPDVHVVDTVEEAHRIARLLMQDYRHETFACDTEVGLTFSNGFPHLDHEHASKESTHKESEKDLRGCSSCTGADITNSNQFVFRHHS